MNFLLQFRDWVDEHTDAIMMGFAVTILVIAVSVMNILLWAIVIYSTLWALIAAVPVSLATLGALVYLLARVVDKRGSSY